MSTKPHAEFYTAVVRPVWNGESVSFEGSLKEFGRSVTSEGSTPGEALARLYENGEMLIEDVVSEGEALPEFEPVREWESYSGKMTVRMPRSLHCKLHILAEEEGVSLNSMAVTLLSWGAERKHCEIRPLVAHNLFHNQFTVQFNRQPVSAEALSGGGSKVSPIPLSTGQNLLRQLV